MPTWKKILTKTPVAGDLAGSAADGYVLTATGNSTTAPAWEAVGAGSDTTYSIKAEAVSGGADLDLDAGGSGTGTDTIKFASAGATTVSRTGASTIQISSLDTQPCGGDGHAKYAITDTFASGEVTQMQNIGATTISADQWGYLGAATGAITNTDTMGSGFTIAATTNTAATTVTQGDTVTMTAGDDMTVVATSDGVITFNNSNPNVYMDAGDGIDVVMTTVSADIKDNSGLVFATGSVGNRELSLSLSASGISGTLDETDGGTGISSYATGDLLYATAANTLGVLAGDAGNNGKYLQAGMTGVPMWVTHSDSNTWRGVTAGGNTLSTSETLAFGTGGSNITITESGGAVTINGTAGPCGGDGHAKYAITDTFASTEVTAMQNIGAVTITNTQWGYLGAASGAITNTECGGDGHAKYAITDTFASSEVTAVKNIDSVTITNTQWGYLGAASGAITNTETVTMGGGLVVTGDLTISGDTITTSTETLEIADNKMVLNSDLGENAGVDAGFIVHIGTDDTQRLGNDYNPSFYYDVSTKRWVMGDTGDATPFTSFGSYTADVMQVRIDDAAINTSSSEVPIGHLQYHSGELHLRVA